MPRGWLIVAICMLGRASAAPLPAAPQTHAEHVPVSILANFSKGEIVAIAGIGIVDLASLIFQKQLVRLRGAPLIGDPPSWDRQLSAKLYHPDAGKFLRFADEIGGIVIPAAAWTFYGLDATITQARGSGFTGDIHAKHHFLAFSEAFLLNALVTQAAKIGVGRMRPNVHFGYAARNEDSTSQTLSFYSGHASTAFCVGSYLWRDVSDYLVAEKGHDVFLGRIVPGVIIYGAASIVGYSRIYDQQHYLSDVLVGAAVGSLIGHLVYALHFDSDGHPRDRDGTADNAGALPKRNVFSIGGVF